jgi:hypothetical protein
MKFEEFKVEIEAYYRDACREAESFKDPHLTIDRLNALYRSFDHHEREMANTVFSEWILSTEGRKRYDAQVLVDQLKIANAIPALQESAQRLAKSTEPGASFEIEKVQRILANLAD